MGDQNCFLHSWTGPPRSTCRKTLHLNGHFCHKVRGAQLISLLVWFIPLVLTTEAIKRCSCSYLLTHSACLSLLSVPNPDHIHILLENERERHERGDWRQTLPSNSVWKRKGATCEMGRNRGQQLGWNGAAATGSDMPWGKKKKKKPLLPFHSFHAFSAGQLLSFSGNPE